MPKKTLLSTLLALEKNIFICSGIYHFMLLFFTINNEHIQKRFVRSLYLLLLFHLFFSEIMKALEDLSRNGF